MIMRTIVIAVGLLISAAIAAPSWAASLKITDDDGSQLAEFDRKSIEALGLIEFETETPWTDGVVHFEGVSIKRILSKAGISNVSVTGLAMDDYAAYLDANSIEKYNPIIATRMNGTLMSLDDKGPFWIMFDFDDIAEEPSIELRSLAVWHLVELEVE